MSIEPVNKKHARIELLMEILGAQKSASISDLAARLDVSHMTIRRDLELLETSGKVRLFHGGVALTGGTGTGYRGPYRLDAAEMINHREKEAIARHAASLVNNGDIVFFDGGSTVEMVPEFITPGTQITAVCYSYNILSRVLEMENSKIILLGGAYHSSSDVFESAESTTLLKRTRITKAFISANAVQADLGVTCSNQFEVATKQAAIESSLARYLLVDSSKFGNVFSSFFAEAGDFHLIITDDHLQPEIFEEYSSRGILIAQVPVGAEPPDRP